MELSRPVVVQHYGRLILTLDFQGQILNMLYDDSVADRYKKSISIIETVISIDYRYIDFLASYCSDRSRGLSDGW